MEIPIHTERSLHSFKTKKIPTPNTVHTQGKGPTITAEHLRSSGDVSVHTQGASYSRKPSSHYHTKEGLISTKWLLNQKCIGEPELCLRSDAPTPDRQGTTTAN